MSMSEKVGFVNYSYKIIIYFYVLILKCYVWFSFTLKLLIAFVYKLKNLEIKYYLFILCKKLSLLPLS